MSMGTTTSANAVGGPPAANRLPWRRRRAVRIGIRTGQAVIALIIVGCSAFGVLLLVTPSVGNARQLAKRMDDIHHAPYPGAVVPARFAAALEATEDHRFNSEPGLDPLAVARFVLGQVTGKGDQGGATLYAQLAKVLYTPGDASVKAQLEQAALAVKLRFSYGPAEVLRLYAAVVYFGHGHYGLQDASCGYYGVQPSQMSWPQAALLAGLVYAPTADDPVRAPASAMARERHVMGRLAATGALTPAQADAYLRIPVSQLLAGSGDGGC